MQVQLKRLQAACVFSSRHRDLRCWGQLKSCFSVSLRRRTAWCTRT